MATESWETKDGDGYRRKRVTQQCTICLNEFDSEALLHVHTPCYYTFHGIKKPETGSSGKPVGKIYKCHKCDQSFANMNYLRRHVTYHYERTFECKQCEFRGFTQRDIVRHLQIHTEQKNYKCSECDKEFRHNQMLQEHMRRHAGERPFKCDWAGCDRSFVTHNGLKDHIKRHKNDKSAVCPVCGKNFVRKYELRTHLSRNHPDYSGPIPSNSSSGLMNSSNSSNSYKSSQTSTASTLGEGSAMDTGDIKPNLSDLQEKVNGPKEEIAKTEIRKLPSELKSIPQSRFMLKKKFCCSSCGMSFPKVSEYIAHRPCFFKNNAMIDNPDSQFECGLCEADLVRGFDKIVAHYAEHFDTEIMYDCVQCTEILLEKDLKEHFKLHENCLVASKHI